MGQLAARLATQVIKAYEDKKNHRPIEHLKPPSRTREERSGSSRRKLRPHASRTRGHWNVERRWQRLRTPAGGPLPR